MAEPIYPKVETDPEALAEIGFDYLRSVWPGWEPTSEGDGIAAVIRAEARKDAEVRDVASDVPREGVLPYLGKSIFGPPPLVATPATVQATITMRDSAGYTVAAGTEVLVKTAGDDGVRFTVVSAVTVAPGSRATAAGEVTLRAAAGFEGEIANGLDATNEAITVQAFDHIERIELVGVSSGGVEAETAEEYERRFVDERQVDSGTPILPRDFEILARRVPGVARALALNLYDPVTRTTDNERMVTVAVVDANGLPLATAVKDEVAELLESMRELNWRSPVIDPTYTAVDVAFEAVAWDDAVPADVEAAALAALEAYLDPGTWGTRPEGEQPGWIDDDTVRYLEVAAVLNEVPGLRHVTDLRIGLEGRALARADVTLAGPAPLPRPGAGIAGIVSGGA